MKKYLPLLLMPLSLFAALQKDEIISIDSKTDEAIFKSGRREPLSEKARFRIKATPAQKKISEGVKEQELKFQEKGGSFNAFVKGLENNIFTKFANNYLSDPAIAGMRAFSKGEGQEDARFLERLGQNYVAQRMGRREAEEIIREENPKASLLGNVGALAFFAAFFAWLFRSLRSERRQRNDYESSDGDD